MWVQFVEMRKSIRKPLTENAVNILVKKLIGFGEQANTALENSIVGSYQSVYPPKQQNTAPAQQNPQLQQRRRFGQQDQVQQMRTVGGQTA